MSDKSVEAKTIEVPNLPRDTQSGKLLSLNGLRYVMGSVLSTSVHRTFIKNYANQQQYPQERVIVFDVNNGSTYVDPDNVALKIDVEITTGTGASNCSWSDDEGDATQLFESILIKSKNGEELDRIDRLGLYSVYWRRYTQSSEKFEKESELAGRGFAGPVAGATGTFTFVIPMKYLSGLFRPTNGVKMPAALLSGCRIELTLQKPDLVFNTPDATASSSYVVNNPELIMASIENNDMTNKVLNAQSAIAGLDYSYTRIWTNSITNTNQRNSIQVKKAVAFAKKSYVVSLVEHVDQKVNNSLQTIDSDTLARAQFRVGANFYPQSKIEGKHEALYVTQDCFNCNRENTHCQVSLSDYDAGKMVVGASLERDNQVDFSGVPINNSAQLEATIELTSAPIVPVTHVVFLEYDATARVFLTNVKVKL